jgi:hypothetical protein
VPEAPVARLVQVTVATATLSDAAPPRQPSWSRSAKTWAS